MQKPPSSGNRGLRRIGRLRSRRGGNNAAKRRSCCANVLGLRRRKPGGTRNSRIWCWNRVRTKSSRRRLGRNSRRFITHNFHRNVAVQTQDIGGARLLGLTDLTSYSGSADPQQPQASLQPPPPSMATRGHRHRKSTTDDTYYHTVPQSPLPPGPIALSEPLSGSPVLDREDDGEVIEEIAIAVEVTPAIRWVHFVFGCAVLLSWNGMPPPTSVSNCG